MPASMISKTANQMSMRKGIPICNHGMVPVYHPTLPRKGSQSIFSQAAARPVAAPMPQPSNLAAAGMITSSVLGTLGNIFDMLGGIFTGGTTPQTTTPQTSTPQTSTPQTSTPQTSTPQTSTPQTSTPQTSTPQTSTPQTSTPQTSTPQTSTPQTSTPQTSTPETSTPQTSTPQTSTPQTSTPQTSTPQTTNPRYRIGQQERTSHTRVKIMHGCGPYQYAQLYRHSDGSPLTHSECMELVRKFDKNGTNPMLREGNSAMHLETKIRLSSGEEVTLSSNLDTERDRIENETVTRDRGKPGVPDREYVTYSDDAMQQWYLVDSTAPDGKRYFNSREELDAYLLEQNIAQTDVGQDE